jgi:mono/diheme cytochrome c family protein/glucose/arabinose dehydrogenase
MRFPTPIASLALLLASSLPCLAQIGDKKGEAQIQIVPDSLVPPSPAQSPYQELKSFQLAPGYKIELAASDPLIGDPVAGVFGPDGRLWIVEMQGYMPDLEGSTEDQPHGRVVVLTDTNNDGVFDKAEVFLDQIVMPRALALHRDGVLVGAPPHLWFYRDTNGDGKADEKIELANDFGVRVDPTRPQLANPERAPNALLWGHDNWLQVGAYTARFKFKDGRWIRGLSNFRGQWGQGQDDYGRIFHNSNSDQLRADIIPSSYLARNPNLGRTTGLNWKVATEQLVWPIRVNPGINRGYRPEMLRDNKLKEFTAACAPFIYRADLLPADAYGNAFICEPAGNLIKRNVITAEKGALSAKPYYDQKEFLASTDERFRPVNLITGPDGALYVIDFYRGIIQHRISLTTYLRDQIVKRGLDKPLALGRVWRIAPEGVAPVAGKKLSEMTPAEWIAELSSGNAWRRETAQRLLVERNDANLAPALVDVATNGAAPMGRVHALWTLEGMGALRWEAVAACIRHADPRVRAAGVRNAESFLSAPKSEDAVALLKAVALTETVPEVQQQLVLSLGEARTLAFEPDFDAYLSAAALAHRAEDVSFIQDALISGLQGRELEVFTAILRKPELYSKTLPAALLRCVFAERKSARVEKALSVIAALPLKSQQLTLLGSLAIHPTVTAKRPIKCEAEPAALVKFGKNKDAGIQKSLAAVQKLIVWPGKPGVQVVALTPLTNEEQSQFDAGKQTYLGLCAACHQPTGKGLEGLAPPLADSEWVNGNPARIARIVMHGLRGPVKVKGLTYSLDMPAAGFLSDAQIADVLTYIRREWDHEAAPVKIDFVKTIREQTKERNDAWTEKELLGIK